MLSAIYGRMCFSVLVGWIICSCLAWSPSPRTSGCYTVGLVVHFGTSHIPVLTVLVRLIKEEAKEKRKQGKEEKKKKKKRNDWSATSSRCTPRPRRNKPTPLHATRDHFETASVGWSDELGSKPRGRQTQRDGGDGRNVGAWQQRQTVGAIGA